MEAAANAATTQMMAAMTTTAIINTNTVATTRRVDLGLTPPPGCTYTGPAPAIHSTPSIAWRHLAHSTGSEARGLS
jgi:hypothetical protein